MSQDQNATAFHFLMVKVTEPFLLSPALEEESFFPDMIGDQTMVQKIWGLGGLAKYYPLPRGSASRIWPNFRTITVFIVENHR
jgi:hypothetical protein